MAERTVNVRINYQVSTADIQKATAASAAAQKATDDLRKATTEYGKATQQAGKQASDSLKQTQKDVSSLSSEFNSLYSSIKLIISAGLAREMVDMTLNAARLSGAVEGVTRAFNRLPNATLLINKLREATHGTVNDLELMQKALMATNYKIPLERLGTLLEFAAVKAQQTGQEVNHLVDFIVTGIGLRSIKRLDDLGITANRLKGALGGVSLQAATMGQTVDAVTTLMQEDLERTGGFAETAATEVGKLETAWHDLKVTVSEALTSPAILKFYQMVVSGMQTSMDFVTGGRAKIQQRDANAAAVKDVQHFQEMFVTKEVLKDRQKTLDVVQQEANTRQQMIGRNNDELKQLKERSLAITDSGKRVSYQQQAELDMIAEQSQFYHFKNLVLKESIKILKEYMQSLQVVTDLEGGEDGLNRAEELRQRRAGGYGEPFRKTTTLRHSAGTLGANTAIGGVIPEPLEAQIEVIPIMPIDNWDKFVKDFQENWRGFMAQGVDDTVNYFIQLEMLEVDHLHRRIDRIRVFYDEQMLLAGDNERAKSEMRIKEQREVAKIQREIAMKEWEAKRNSIILSTAGGVARAFIDYQWPYALIPAAAVAVQGGLQLDIANKSRPRFAKGVLNLQGPGTETSDSIPSLLSKGESVMTSDETKRAFGVLKAIKQNKIDDEILKRIDFSGGRTVTAALNDERIVSELKGIRKSQYHLEDQFGLLFRVHSDDKGNRHKVRARVMHRG